MLELEDGVLRELSTAPSICSVFQIMSHSAHEKEDEDKPLPKDEWETGHSQAAMVAHPVISALRRLRQDNF